MLDERVLEMPTVSAFPPESPMPNLRILSNNNLKNNSELALYINRLTHLLLNKLLLA